MEGQWRDVKRRTWCVEACREHAFTQRNSGNAKPSLLEQVYWTPLNPSAMGTLGKGSSDLSRLSALLDCLRGSQLPQKANGSLPARTGLEQHRPIALAPAERAIGAFAVVLV